jgi:two-component system CheB/CheR fusion protein
MGIRRFTPMAERVLNLIPGDINRPVGQIKTNLVDCDLEAVTRETVETMMPREREVQDKQGKWYSLRIRPYKNVDNRIDGAVLTLMDIATVKRYEQQLEQSKDQLQGVLALAGDPMVLIDEDRRIILGNQAFGQMVAKPLDKLPGLRLADLGRGAWQAPEMLALLEQAERNTGTPHAATLPWPSAGDERALPVRAIRLAPNGSSPLTALSIKDVDYATQ